MKKILFLTLILKTLLLAQEYKYELSPMIGYTFNTQSYLPLEDYPIGGLEFQYNLYNSKIATEFSFYYERGEYNIPDPYTLNIYTLALRGVYTLNGSKRFHPFVKAGLSDRILTAQNDELRTALFLDLGTGFKTPLNNTTALKLELLSSINENNEQLNYHFSLLAGISFSFEKLRKPPHKLKRVTKHRRKHITQKAIHRDNRRYMTEPKDIKPKVQPAPKVVVKEEINLDKDNDGVVDSADNCLNTAAGVKVTADGCEVIEPTEELLIKPLPEDPVVVEEEPLTPQEEPVVLAAPVVLDLPAEPIEEVKTQKSCEGEIFKKLANLQVNFLYKSTKLTSQTKKDLQILSKFLNKKPQYNVKIIGYTDNVGSRHYNKRLSKRRANAVKRTLVEEGGIDPLRIITLGLGEAYPIASNKTAEGRAKNRRIEIILVHKNDN